MPSVFRMAMVVHGRSVEIYTSPIGKDTCYAKQQSRYVGSTGIALVQTCFRDPLAELVPHMYPVPANEPLRGSPAVYRYLKWWRPTFFTFYLLQGWAAEEGSSCLRTTSNGRRQPVEAGVRSRYRDETPPRGAVHRLRYPDRCVWARRRPVEGLAGGGCSAGTAQVPGRAT